VKQANSWDQAFYDNDFRKKLGITDDQQRQLIEEYVKDKRGDEESRQKLKQRFLEYYKLASEPKQ
jgi:hypothetical protein